MTTPKNTAPQITERAPQADESVIAGALPNSDSVPMTLRYQRPSEVHADHVQLFAVLDRTPVQFKGIVKDPLVFRDCLSALFAVVSSDYRYVPRDRSAYAAYVEMRRSNQYANLFAAQRAYFDWLFEHDPLAYCLLDPVVQVHPQGVTFEVFSRDEASYAQLTFDHTLFETQQPPVYGVTHIDFSDALIKGIEKVRTFHETTLEVGQQAVALTSTTSDPLTDQAVIEKRIQVPRSWLRGFLQVQSAMQLAQDRFSIEPIDLYNVLRHLRLHKDIKGKRRGLVIELIPQQRPTIYLEPNGTIFHTQGAVYTGRQAKMIRLWGRRRLALLQRVLPHTQHIEVALLGQGMPSYWTLRGTGFHLMLSMTGFTQSNWSQALNFDLLLPRTEIMTDAHVQPVLNALMQMQVARLDEMTNVTGLTSAVVREALQHASQQGLVMFDAAEQRYRYRPLTDEPLDMAQFQYRNLAEKQAYDLISRPDAVQDFQVLNMPGEGIEITGTIIVQEDRRSYSSQLRLNEEGMVNRATCSCHQIQQHGLSQGVCSHLVTLRIAYARYDAARDPKTTWQETRLFTRRRQRGQQEWIEQLSLTLNQKRLFVISDQPALLQKGPRLADHLIREPGKRRQQFTFNTPEQAQSAYFQQIRQIKAKGFIENSVS